LEAGPPFVLPLPDVQSHRLKSGVTVLLVHRSGTPLTTVNLTVRTGAIDDPAGSFGLAHLLEHASTTAGPTRSQSYAELLERKGAIGVNAVTTWDVTQYFAQVPREVLPQWISGEAARLQTPAFHDFAVERDAALRELSQSQNVEFMSSVVRRVYPEWMTVHTPFGVLPDMKTITRASAERFFRRAYTPERIVITLVGDLDLKESRELCDRAFGDWKGPAARLEETTLHGRGSPALQVRGAGASTTVALALPRKNATPLEAVVLDAASELIESESLSPFRSSWRGAAWASYPGRRGPSVFAVVLIPSGNLPVTRLPEPGRFILRAIVDAPDADLEGAILLRRVRLAEKLGRAPSLAAALGEYQAIYGTHRRLLEEWAAASELTPELLRTTFASLSRFD
jgi:predicted Zn-dependent peptidase